MGQKISKQVKKIISYSVFFFIKCSNARVPDFISERWLGWHEVCASGLWHKRDTRCLLRLSHVPVQNLNEGLVERMDRRLSKGVKFDLLGCMCFTWGLKASVFISICSHPQGLPLFEIPWSSLLFRKTIGQIWVFQKFLLCCFLSSSFHSSFSNLSPCQFSSESICFSRSPSC